MTICHLQCSFSSRERERGLILEFRGYKNFWCNKNWLLVFIASKNRFLLHQKFLYYRISRIFRGGKSLQNAIIYIYVLVLCIIMGLKVKIRERLFFREGSRFFLCSGQKECEKNQEPTNKNNLSWNFTFFSHIIHKLST